MMGGALGGLEAMVFPAEGIGFWPLVSMGAILGGTMRSPFTGVIFALELTHDVNMLLPLLIAVTIAHGFTVLTLRRSILTEKVARRGYHLSREYAVDPLEILFAREVMRSNIFTLASEMPREAVVGALRFDSKKSVQRLFPVLDGSTQLAGVVTRGDLEQLLARTTDNTPLDLKQIVRPTPTVAHPDEPLRYVVHRMAATGLTRFPVVTRGDDRKLLGIIALDDLLKARSLNLEAERRRERVLNFGFLAFPFAFGKEEPEPETPDELSTKKRPESEPPDEP
jgi:CBS domain-containing protein